MSKLFPARRHQIYASRAESDSSRLAEPRVLECGGTTPLSMAAALQKRTALDPAEDAVKLSPNSLGESEGLIPKN